MVDREITVNSRKFDGTISRTWKCRFVKRTGGLMVLEGEFDADVSHPDLGEISKGTISREFFWFDAWFNVFRFQHPEGALRNFYANLCLPPRFADSVLDYVDLDIDILVWPDGTAHTVDLEDFERNSARFSYSPEMVATVDKTRRQLSEMIEKRQFPFEF